MPYLTAALGHGGKTEAARQSIDSLRRLAPDIRLELVGESWPHAPQSWNCVLDDSEKADTTRCAATRRGTALEYHD